MGHDSMSTFVDNVSLISAQIHLLGDFLLPTRQRNICQSHHVKFTQTNARVPHLHEGWIVREEVKKFPAAYRLLGKVPDAMIWVNFFSMQIKE